MKIGRINSTAKGKEGATSKKVEGHRHKVSVRKTDHGYPQLVKEPAVRRRAENRLSYQRVHEGERQISVMFALESEGLDFMSS